ncbi:phospholipase D-like domain-containing protein [Archangium lansingense]|uniref:phospholipase D-like domain-containing protein n=1 Tax=Archangium lansingense TaxID=2995310 RepID=UPI003B7A45C4
MSATAQVAYVGEPRQLAHSLHELIQMARESIVLQMYLFAADGHLALLRPGVGRFPHAQMVADWLIEKRRREPHVLVVVVLDTNTPDDPARVRIPGDLVRHQLERAGVLVLNANLFHTRFEARRTLLPGMDFHLRWREHGPGDWVARQQHWQSLHNVEDHRKNLVIDQGAWGAVTSHNLFDAAACWHENLLLFDGEPAQALWGSAREALRLALEIPQRLDDAGRTTLQALLSREAPSPRPYETRPLAPALERFTAPEAPALPPSPPRSARLRVLDNEAIRPALEAAIDRVPPGGHISVATTYFSDLPMLERLFDAARRGVSVRVLIDDTAALPLPASAAFFVRQLVNRRVLETARRRAPPGFALRVHHSGGGTMMHLKTAAFVSPEGEALLIGGQANYTPNSFNGAWWETDVEVESPELVADFLAHFDALWALPASEPLQPVRPWALPWAHACLATLALLSRCGLQP